MANFLVRAMPHPAYIMNYLSKLSNHGRRRLTVTGTGALELRTSTWVTGIEYHDPGISGEPSVPVSYNHL